MKKITIYPHDCSREEYEELIEYLEDNCWDYLIEETEAEEKTPDSGDILSESWLEKSDDWRDE
jgi:hypothetical protein